MRRATHGPEVNMVATDNEIVTRVTGVQCELRRGSGNAVFDQTAIEAHALIAGLGIGARLAQDV